MKKKYHKLKLKVIDLIAVIFSMFMMSGSTSSNYLYISIALFFCWVIALLITEKSFISVPLKDTKVLLLAIYLIYSFLCGLVRGTIIFSAKQLGAGVLLFSPILLFDYYITPKNRERLQIVLYLVLLVWLYYSIKALLFYQEHQQAARDIASNAQIYGNVAIGGGYGLAYGASLLSIVGINLILDKRIKTVYEFVFWVIFVFAGILIVFQTNSTITLLSFAFGIVICVFFRNENDLSSKQHFQYRYIFKYIFVIAILLILVLNIERIAFSIINLAKKMSSIYNLRLVSFGYALIGQSEGEYTIGRFSIVMKAMNTFLKNPIFGVCYKHGNGLFSTSDAGLGNHCEWIDALANLGLVGGIPFLLIYVLQVKQILHAKTKITKGWIYCLFLLGLFNPFRTWQSQFALFFVIPAIVKINRFKKFI